MSGAIMKTITLTDDEIKFLIDLVQDESKSADILRLESEHVLEHGFMCFLNSI